MEKQLNQNLLNQGQPSKQNPPSYKAAVYLRVASISQSDEDAINIQRDTLRSFAKQQGYAVCMEYADNGFSGLNLDRPGFIQMDADINAGKIDTIIVRSIDRIARNYLLAGKWLTELELRGAKLITADDSLERNIFGSEFIQELVRHERKQKQKNGKAAKGERGYV